MKITTPKAFAESAMVETQVPVEYTLDQYWLGVMVVFCTIVKAVPEEQFRQLMYYEPVQLRQE
jgi:hypothetical protein